MALAGGLRFAAAEGLSMRDTEPPLVAGAAAPAPEHPMPGKWGIWGSGIGAYGDRDGDDIASRYDYHIYGFVAGLDYRSSPHLLAGIGGGYSTTDLDLDLLVDNGDVKSYQGVLYSSYVDGPWYADGIVSYGGNQYETQRGVAFGGFNRIAVGDYDGDEIAGYLEGGRSFDLRGGLIQPYLALQIIRLSRDGFTETGAGALNLVVADEDVNSVQGSLGVRMAKEYKTKGGTVLVPEGRLRWTHEFSSDDYLVNARFAGSPAGSYVVKGDRPDRDRLALGLGLTAKLQKNLDLFLDYDADISGDMFANAVTAGIIYRW